MMSISDETCPMCGLPKDLPSPNCMSSRTHGTVEALETAAKREVLQAFQKQIRRVRSLQAAKGALKAMIDELEE